jgi:hypothetical protein
MMSLWLSLLLGLAACATSGPAPSGTAASPGPRSAPDDEDLLDVIPAGPETLIDLDVAVLRTSAWSKGLLEAVTAEERTAKTEAQGFDDIADVDRAIFAVSEGGNGPTTLMLARGRFEQSRIAQAHSAPSSSSSPWTPSSWRGSPVWSQGDAAVALLTPRTFLSGTPAAVREAIDCAWGLTPGIRQSGPIATLERGLGVADPHRRRPALLAIVSITEPMKKRVSEEIELPAGLEHVGLRLDIEHALDLDLLALLQSERDAAAAAHLVDATVSEIRSRKALNALGLATIFDGATVAADGTRMRGHLHLPEAKRDDLAQRIALVLEAIVRQQRK